MHSARRPLLAAGVLCLVTIVARAQIAAPVCVESERPDPGRPDLVLERQLFGFHDEEVVICSPGSGQAAHLAARLWVPAGCEAPGSCPAVLIAHGFAFTKELTFADMMNAARRGMTVLSYDVRGHGASGGQVGFMGREEIADQAAVLRWLHERVAPTRVGVYGLSQGGAHAVMAAIFNCGAVRAASFDDGSVSCDDGGRWVHAIAPVQSPTRFSSDGTCPVFGLQAVPQSRFSPGLTREALRCAARGTALEDAVAEATEALAPLDFSVNDYLSRADRIDVPAYLVTSFFDRLVLPQNVTRLYEALRQRADYHEDLRLTVSNDGHGSVGGNFAVLDDVFAWLAVRLGASGAPLRDAPVVIAQEWDGNAYRLESEWPIPGTVDATFFLSRAAAEDGRLLEASPASPEPPDEMRNVPFPSSPPGLFFAESLGQVTAALGATAIPFVRLVYLTDPLPATIEVTGLPEVSLWVSSSNAEGRGQGQLHAALFEVAADGGVTEFARNRRGSIELGTEPVEIAFDLTVSSHRIDAGNRLMLAITPTDPAEAQPFLSADSIFVHHGAGYPSRLRVPLVDPERMPPPGEPPVGAAFPDDALGAICQAFGQQCG